MVIIHINFNRYCLAVHLEKPNVFLLNTSTACFINLKLLLPGANPEKVQGGAHALDVWGFGGGQSTPHDISVIIAWCIFCIV